MEIEFPYVYQLVRFVFAVGQRRLADDVLLDQLRVADVVGEPFRRVREDPEAACPAQSRVDDLARRQPPGLRRD